MIKIETVKVKRNFEVGYLNESVESTINPVLKSFKVEFERIFKDHKCETHDDDSKGLIVINTNNPEGEMKFELSDFCCAEFEQEIKQNLNIKE